MTTDYLAPWCAALPGKQSCVDELYREVGPGHPLFGATARLIAFRVDQDDFLFEVSGLSHPLAVVHLTFSGKRESDPRWPHTQLYASLQQWKDECMLPDHREREDEGAEDD